MPVLAKFREYHVWFKGQEGGVVRKRTKSLLNTAHARLRVAKQFQDVRIQDVSPLLVSGYSAGIRLLLTSGGVLRRSPKGGICCNEVARLPERGML
jgi:hypothetical protein